MKTQQHATFPKTTNFFLFRLYAHTIANFLDQVCIYSTQNLRINIDLKSRGLEYHVGINNGLVWCSMLKSSLIVEWSVIWKIIWIGDFFSSLFLNGLKIRSQPNIPNDLKPGPKTSDFEHFRSSLEWQGRTGCLFVPTIKNSNNTVGWLCCFNT